MARPIKATPKLTIEESREFLKRVAADLERPASYSPTPKLDRVRELVKEYAAKGKK